MLAISTSGNTVVTAIAVAKLLGYCPPERDTCHVSPRSDVYSTCASGVLLALNDRTIIDNQGHIELNFPLFHMPTPHQLNIFAAFVVDNKGKGTEHFKQNH